MKFGIFFELSVPRPFGPVNEHLVYSQALEQCRVADALGFDHVWAVEHHFLEEYSHCSAPEVFLAAVAAQTSRTRVGHGAVVCVPEMNHPIRVAERAAALDLVSGGRLEFGTARSSTWTELGGFRANPDETKATWDEFVRVLPSLWTKDAFEWRGSCFTMPERNVLPKPLQQPHPPMWVTVTTPGTELDAADRGLGSLGVSAVSYGEQERRTAEYHRRVQQCDPVVLVVNDQVHTQNFLFCHEDARTAARVGLPMVMGFNALNAHLYWTREAYPTWAYPSLGNLGQALRQASGDDPSAAKGLPEGVGIGDPDHLIRVVERWDSMGVDGINFVLDAAGLIAHEQIIESLELFAREVIPRFRTPEQLAARVQAPTTIPSRVAPRTPAVV